MKKILFASLIMLALTSFTKGTRKPMMIQSEVEIKNVAGFGGRASANFTQLASKYKCYVWLTLRNKRVMAKIIMAIMMLNAKKGNRLTLAISKWDTNF
jgi:phosphocarrier protein